MDTYSDKEKFKQRHQNTFLKRNKVFALLSMYNILYRVETKTKLNAGLKQVPWGSLLSVTNTRVFPPVQSDIRRWGGGGGLVDIKIDFFTTRVHPYIPILTYTAPPSYP